MSLGTDGRECQACLSDPCNCEKYVPPPLPTKPITVLCSLCRRVPCVCEQKYEKHKFENRPEVVTDLKDLIEWMPGMYISKEVLKEAVKRFGGRV